MCLWISKEILNFNFVSLERIYILQKFRSKESGNTTDKVISTKGATMTGSCSRHPKPNKPLKGRDSRFMTMTLWNGFPKTIYGSKASDIGLGKLSFMGSSKKILRF